MCGLLGYSGNINFDLDKIKILFILNEARGVHSAGVFNDCDLSWYNKLKKETGDATTNLLSKHEIKESKLLMGHTRHATSGEKTVNNAHPFMFSKVVGMHNGTLDNLDNLLEKYSKLYPNLSFDKTNISVDSKIFPYYFDNISNYDILKDLGGSCATIWYEKDSNVLNIYRNKDRELHYGYIKQGDDIGMYISSEELPLKTIGCTSITEFKPNIYYKIKNGILSKEQIKIISSPLKKKEIVSNNFLNWINHNLKLVTYNSNTKVKSVVRAKDGKSIVYNLINGDIHTIKIDTLTTRKWHSDTVIFINRKQYKIKRIYNDYSIDLLTVSNIDELQTKYKLTINKYNSETYISSYIEDALKYTAILKNKVNKKYKSDLVKIDNSLTHAQQLIDYYGYY